MDNRHLRNFREEDFEAFHALVSDFDVVKMLASWPWPPDPAFTRARMTTPEVKAGQVCVIEVGGKFAGSIGGVDGGLGCMLAPSFWGQGIATWATQKMLDDGFRKHGWKIAKAGCWEDNHASAAVLRKCGFREVGEEVAYCKARGCDLRGLNFELARAEWEKQQVARP